MKLAVGDLVVYGNHGIGRVAALESKRCSERPQEVVVLELEELRVTLPLERARTQLRPLADGAELRRVGEALREDGELSSSNWLSRRRETLEKLIGANARGACSDRQRRIAARASALCKWRQAAALAERARDLHQGAQAALR